MAADDSATPHSSSDPSTDGGWGDVLLPESQDSVESPPLPSRRGGSEKLPIQLIAGVVNGRADKESADDDSVRKIPSQPGIAGSVPKNLFGFESRRTPAWELEHGMSTLRKADLRWIIRAGIGVLLLLIACLALLPLINSTNSVPENDTTIADALRKSNAEHQNASEDLIQQSPAAMKIFRDYATASVVDDFLLTLRDAKTVEPLVRKVRAGPLVAKNWLGDDSATWLVSQTEGKPYAFMQGTLPDYTRYQAYFVSNKGRIELDWKATTAYGTATFEELKHGSGDASEIRGVVAPDVYYTADFKEEDFQCYQLVSADGLESIWCYAPRGSSAASQLAKFFLGGDILQQNIVQFKVTLALQRSPTGGYPNQWMVAAVLHQDWISP